MSRRPFVLSALVPLLLAGSLVSSAQEPRSKEALLKATQEELSRLRPATKLVRVRVVLSRYRGDEKVLSLPYELLVGTEGKRAGLRMGVNVPVPTQPVAEGDAAKPAAFQYQSVGTNIDCQVSENRQDGLFVPRLSIEHSAVVGGRSGDAKALESLPRAEVPLIQRFDAHLEPVLKDGETVQVLASTDPITGEVLKVEVTLSVVR